MSLTSKKILSAWEAHIKAESIENNKIVQNDLHKNNVFYFNENMGDEGDLGIELIIPEKQLIWLRNSYVIRDKKGNKKCENICLLFPSIKKIENINNKEISTLFPLFSFDISDWLTSDNKSFVLPVLTGNDIAILKSVFENEFLLDIGLDEFGDDQNISSFISEIIDQPYLSFRETYPEFLKWIKKILIKNNEKFKSEKKATYKLHRFSFITKLKCDDYNAIQDIKDLDYVRSIYSKAQFPLLDHYIKNMHIDKNNIEEIIIPVYGLFESNYALGRGQIECITRANDDESLIAVRGAPGTGKTTLFKSLIANRIVRRSLDLIEGKDHNRGMMITSTAIKAVINVVEDLRKDEVTKGVNWLWFQGGSSDQRKNESIRTQNLINQLCDDEFNEVIQVKAKKDILKYKSKIDKDRACYQQLINEINKQFEIFDCISIEEMCEIKDKMHKVIFSEIALLGYSDFDQIKLIEAKENAKKEINTWDEQDREYSLSLDEFRKWRAKSPIELTNENLSEWLSGDLSDLIIESLSIFPKSGIRYWFYRWFSKKFKKIINRFKKPYEKSLTKLDMNDAKFMEYVELAWYTSSIKYDASWKRYHEWYCKGKPDPEYKKNLNKLLDKMADFEHILRACRTVDQCLKEKNKQFSEGDWLEVFRKKYISENRKLYEAAIVYNWHEILKKKIDVIDVLEIWIQQIKSPKKYVTGSGKWKADLKYFYQLLSLVYPVLLSPLPSVRWLTGFNLKDIGKYKAFDMCLCDEAGMVSVHSLVPSLCRSNNAVIVGDPLQIEPIRKLSDHSIAQLKDQYFSNEDVLYERYSPNTVTAYHRAAGATSGKVDEVGGGIVLEEHRRCQKDIANLFIKIANYRGVKIKTALANERIKNAFKKMGERSLMFYGVQGKSNGKPRTNIDEVNEITLVLNKLRTAGYNLRKDIGIVTPYGNQRDLLINEFSSCLGHAKNSEKIGTIHQFQGTEYEVIIYSSVIFKANDYVSFQNNLPNKLNVVVSRAKQQFIVVGNYYKLMKSGGYLKILAESCGAFFLSDTEHQSPSFEKLSACNDDKFIYDCDHIYRFEDLIMQAKNSIKVVVPWIRGFKDHPQLELLRMAKNKGVDVMIYYGFNNINYKCDDGDYELIKKYKGVFGQNCIRVQSGTHEKLIVIDDNKMVLGSWNWLSHNYHKYCIDPIYSDIRVRRETSIELHDVRIIESVLDRIRN